MSGFQIERAAKQVLRTASRQFIEEYFVTLPLHLRAANWLDIQNRYRLKCTSRFEGDIKRADKLSKRLSAHKHKHLSAYVSASAPAHAIDGWSFLGRAVESALRGDSY